MSPKAPAKPSARSEPRVPVALSIAGSDSGGGAGVQGDLLTFAAHRVHGTAVLTAVTAQNTRGVHAVGPIDPALISAQLTAVLDDFDVAAAKTGMLVAAPVVDVVVAALRRRPLPLVVDPVVVSSSGATLLDDDGVARLRADLLPLAAVVTPNLPELAVLTGLPVTGAAEIAAAACRLLDQGCAAVLVTGGHAAGDPVDRLYRPGMATTELGGPRIATTSTHGTGCALSAAITAELARGAALLDAVGAARRFVAEALACAEPGIGHGAGPLHLLHRFWRR